jgi:hypothetical protein
MTWTGGAQVAIFRGGEARLNSPVNSSESVSMYVGQWCFSFRTIFIGTSYFIEVLGGENVDMEMPKFLGRFRENR